jgi:hypothetical protein
MVAELRRKAAELAERGIKIDAEEIIRVGEKERDEEKGDLIIVRLKPLRFVLYRI